ncbi:MAG: hypothetical protein WCB05_20800 [Candidatus Sulfotelmatobacter sp.]
MMNLDTVSNPISLLPEFGYGVAESQRLSDWSRTTNPSGFHQSDTTTSSVSYDRSTKAALAFLNADFCGVTEVKHLVLLISKACGDLYLSERGMTDWEAKQEFLRDWLFDELSKVQAEPLKDAARNGDLRFLARRARNAFIDELRRRERSKDALDRNPLRFDVPIGNCGDDDEYTLHDLVGATSEEGPISPIGKTPSLEPSVVRETLEQSRHELIEKLGGQLFAALSAICDQYPDQLSKGEITGSIAKTCDVSEQRARKIHHELISKLCTLKRDEAMRPLVEAFAKAGTPILLGQDEWDPLSYKVQ